MKVVIAGGGTAGHVNPALALALAMADASPVFIGTSRGAEARLVPEAGFELEKIDVRGLDRARPLGALAVAARAAGATAAARRLLRRLQPAVVVGMGGYVSLPVCVAARSLRLPVVIHEQNAVFGLANRVCKRFAQTVAVSFEESLPAAGPKGVFTGNPVSSELASFDPDVEVARARRRWSLTTDRATVLAFGGSQGARTVNAAAAGLVRLWAERNDVQVLHIAGRGESSGGAVVEANGLVYRKVDFVERMVEAYAVADIALCRGGATTVAELCVVGLPAVIVPYPHHRDRQQERHARVLERAGAAVTLADSEASSARVGQTLDALMHDRPRLQEMARASRTLGVPDAAERLAALVRAAAS